MLKKTILSSKYGLTLLTTTIAMSGCTINQPEIEVAPSKHSVQTREAKDLAYKGMSSNWYLGDSSSMQELVSEGGVVVIRKVDETQKAVDLANFERLKKEKAELERLQSDLQKTAKQLNADKELLASLPSTKIKSEVQSIYSVFFPSGVYRLDPKYQTSISEFLTEQLANESDFKHLEIAIIGFADSDGPARKNIILSEKRAKSVMNFIESKKLSTDLKIYIEANGETLNAADNETLKNKAENRRVDIVVKKIKLTSEETAVK